MWELRYNISIIQNMSYLKNTMYLTIGLMELPLFDGSLRETLDLLGVDNMLNVLTSVLLEHQVLLYSEGESMCSMCSRVCSWSTKCSSTPKVSQCAHECTPGAPSTPLLRRWVNVLTSVLLEHQVLLYSEGESMCSMYSRVYSWSTKCSSTPKVSQCAQCAHECTPGAPSTPLLRRWVNVLNVLTSVLLEHQVLLYSEGESMCSMCSRVYSWSTKYSSTLKVSQCAHECTPGAPSATLLRRWVNVLNVLMSVLLEHQVLLYSEGESMCSMCSWVYSWSTKYSSTPKVSQCAQCAHECAPGAPSTSLLRRWVNVLTSVLLEHQVLLYSEGESMCSRVYSWSTKYSSTPKVSQCAHECTPGAPSAPLLRRWVNVLNVLTSVLLEHQVLLYSEGESMCSMCSRVGSWSTKCSSTPKVSQCAQCAHECTPGASSAPLLRRWVNVLMSVLLEHQVLLYSEGESMCSRVYSWSTKYTSTPKVSQCAHECTPGAPSTPLLRRWVNVLNVLTGVLLEHQVLLYSEGESMYSRVYSWSPKCSSTPKVSQCAHECTPGAPSTPLLRRWFNVLTSVLLEHQVLLYSEGESMCSMCSRVCSWSTKCSSTPKVSQCAHGCTPGAPSTPLLRRWVNVLTSVLLEPQVLLYSEGESLCSRVYSWSTKYSSTPKVSQCAHECTPGAPSTPLLRRWVNVLTSVLLEHQVLLYSEGESMCSRVYSWSTKCSSTPKVRKCAHECTPGAPSAPLLRRWVNVLNVLTSVLLEHQVLLYSEGESMYSMCSQVYSWSTEYSSTPKVSQYAQCAHECTPGASSAPLLRRWVNVLTSVLLEHQVLLYSEGESMCSMCSRVYSRSIKCSSTKKVSQCAHECTPGAPSTPPLRRWVNVLNVLTSVLPEHQVLLY